MSAIEHSTPAGYITRISGPPITTRQSLSGGGPIEYTNAGYVTRVGGQPITRRTPAPRPRPQYRTPGLDGAVHGCAIPYNTPLLDHAGDTLVFDPDVVWLMESSRIPIHTEHSALVGYAELSEEFNGVFVNGTIYGAMRHRVGDRKDLSAGLSYNPDDRQRQPDGTYRIHRATIREVSLAKHAQWYPHTPCVVFTKAA